MDLQTTPTSAPQDDSLAFDPAGEIEQLKRMIDGVTMPDGLRDKSTKMLLRLSRMVQTGGFSKEYDPIEKYVQWVVQIPFGKYTIDSLDLDAAEKELNKHHYGLQHVKDMVMEYLSVMKLQSMGVGTTITPVTVASPATAPQPAVQGVPARVAAAEPAVTPVTTPAVVQAPTMPTVTTTALPGATLMTVQAPKAQEMSRLQGSSSHAPVLCFIGIQGVGKTSIAKSIANALNRKFVRVALGAMGTVSQIRGVPITEPSAEPGQIIKGLVTAGTMNPVILLDEIDKTSSESGLRADLMAALLEILDPEQNSTFKDHYIDYPLDLSRCLFITTANNLGGISAALLDRLEVIRFGSYTDEEKIHIAREYMLPKVREATGIGENQLTFDDEVWPMVVRPMGFDAGVRQLERTINILSRKVARLIVTGKATQVHLTKDNFRQFIPEDIGVYS